jgi:hypothetical protein
MGRIKQTSCVGSEGVIVKAEEEHVKANKQISSFKMPIHSIVLLLMLLQLK